MNKYNIPYKQNKNIGSVVYIAYDGIFIGSIKMYLI